VPRAAAASVAGDALLASLIYWRLSRATGRVSLGGRGFLLRVAASAAVASTTLHILGVPDSVSAALARAVFLGVGQLIGMRELHEAFGLQRLLASRSTTASCCGRESFTLSSGRGVLERQ
jgi:hypothetical protein